MKRLFQCCAVLAAALLMQCGGSDSANSPSYPALSGETKTVADAVSKAVKDAVANALASLQPSVFRSSTAPVRAGDEGGKINYSKDGVTVTGSSKEMKVVFKDHTTSSDGHTLVTNGTIDITRGEAAEGVMSETGNGELTLTFDGTAHTMKQSYTRQENHKTKKYTRTGTITFDGTVFSADDTGDLVPEPTLPELNGENLTISNDFVSIFGNVLSNSVPQTPGNVDIDEETMSVKGTCSEEEISLNVTLNGYQTMASHISDQGAQTIFKVSATGNCSYSSKKISDTKNTETNSITMTLAKYSDFSTDATAGEYKNFVINTTVDIENGTKTKTLSVTIDGVKYATRTTRE